MSDIAAYLDVEDSVRLIDPEAENNEIREGRSERAAEKGRGDSCSWLGIVINSLWYEEKLFVNYLLKTIQSIIIIFT